MERLTSFFGVWVLVGFALLISRDRGKASWRTVLRGIAIQSAIGAFLRLYAPGQKVFLAINDGVKELLWHARAGAHLIFGALVAATLACLQTAAVAGVFVSSGGGILFSQ